LRFGFTAPILQPPGYHDFADRRSIWGLHNFWNVVSNVPFSWSRCGEFEALRSEAGLLADLERAAYWVLLSGVALVAIGSGYYHLRPDDGTLFWDRLPWPSSSCRCSRPRLGERISLHAGRLLLIPLLRPGHGIGSLLEILATCGCTVWSSITSAGLPLMILLFPPRYTGGRACWLWRGSTRWPRSSSCWIVGSPLRWRRGPSLEAPRRGAGHAVLREHGGAPPPGSM